MIEFAIRMVILLITDATKMILLQTTEMIIVRIHFFLNLMMKKSLGLMKKIGCYGVKCLQKAIIGKAFLP